MSVRPAPTAIRIRQITRSKAVPDPVVTGAKMTPEYPNGGDSDHQLHLPVSQSWDASNRLKPRFGIFLAQTSSIWGEILMVMSRILRWFAGVRSSSIGTVWSVMLNTGVYFVLGYLCIFRRDRSQEGYEPMVTP